MLTKDSWLFLDPKIAEELFFPKMKKIRVKAIQDLQFYGPVESSYFWHQYPHHFEYLQTMKVEFYCSFNFANFPFDSHHCDINYGSSGVSIAYLRFRFLKNLF